MKIRHMLYLFISAVCLLAVGFAQAQIPGTGSYSGDNQTWTDTRSYEAGNSYVGDAGDNNILTVQGSGNVTFGNGTNGRDLFIARDGQNNTLNVLDGGEVTVTRHVWVGQNASGNNNAVNVNNATVTVGELLLVGANGSNCSLTISNGGVVNAGTADTSLNWVAIGYWSAANDNTVTVNNSTLTGTGELRLGQTGGANHTLDIQNGGNATFGGLVSIGYHANTTNNTITVNGTNSTLSTTGATEILIGRNGTGSKLNVTHGGNVTSGRDVVFGQAAGSNNSTLTVNGTNATLTATRDILMGDGGTTGHKIIIENGGVVHAGRNAGAGWNQGADDNSITVNGTNSTFSSDSLIIIGRNGSNATLNVTNGGAVVSVGNFHMGLLGSSSNNTVTIDDGTLTVNDNLRIGDHASSSNNTLVVQEGGTVIAENASVGFTQGSSDNSVTVKGDNSTMTITGSSFMIGRNASGSVVNVEDGGRITVTTGIAYVAWHATPESSDNELNIRNGTFEADRLFFQGTGQGKVEVTEGGTLTVDDELRVGNATSRDNRVIVGGENSTLTVGGEINLGTQSASTNNTLTIQAGATAQAGNNTHIGAEDQTNNVENVLRVTGAGSTFTSTHATNNAIVISAGTDNKLQVDTGGLVQAGSAEVRSGGLFDVDAATSGIADTLEVATGGNLTLSNNAVVRIGAGYDSVTNNDDENLLTVANGGTLTANGNVTLGTDGLLIVQAGGAVGGAGTIVGDADVFGVLNPGNSAGTLTFTGELTLRSDSTVNIELGGTGEGQYDRIIADSIVVEGGELVFTLIDGYTPEYEDSFQITMVTGGDVIAPFVINDDGLGGGWRIDDSELYTLGIVTIIPEPHTMGLILLGLGAVALRRRLGGKVSSKQ